MYKEICTLHPSNFYFEKDVLRTDKSLVRTRRNITEKSVSALLLSMSKKVKLPQ
jgi:hypothetical protein